MRVACFGTLLFVAAASAEPPVCKQGSTSCPDQDGCSLYLFRDSFLIAGKNLPKGAAVGFQDVVIPFQQHSRRPFPKWLRHNYFLTTNRYEFKFMPGFQAMFDCHSRLANLELASEHAELNPQQEQQDYSSAVNPPMITNRVVAAGDFLFAPCTPETDTKDESPYERLPPKLSLELVAEQSECLDDLVIGPSTVPGAGRGVFAQRPLVAGKRIIFDGPAVHLHRTELRDPATHQDELLLNYCFGLPNSPLLFLPFMPVVNNINHCSEKANVALQWGADFDPSRFFTEPTEKLFEESEETELLFSFRAMRDIEAGEELFLDYGADWEAAWKNRDPNKPFRHAIGLPAHMVPAQWLANETLQDNFVEFATPKLQTGQVEALHLTTGEPLSPEGLFRVGLPQSFSDKMEVWADSMGITDIMKSYIMGNQTLKLNGSERQRINGGTWWVKRFWGAWKSDMHYITPDDDEANQQFMNALADAGFDQVVQAIGKKFNLTSLTCFYPSYIATSHTTYSSMHMDSDVAEQFNLIFPVKQVDQAGPELVLGTDDLSLHVPYKYERDHACLLGKNGMHGTGPANDRGTGQFRMVTSVYMGDFQNKAVLRDKAEEWRYEDPPYPRDNDFAPHVLANIHWKADDPSRTLTTPFGDASSVQA